MKNMANRNYYLVQRGNARKQCLEFRDKYLKAYRAMSRFAKKKGATEFYFSRSSGRLIGLYLDPRKKQLEGWTKPRAKDGLCTPKKRGCPDEKAIAKLQLPLTTKFAMELTGVPCSLQWETKNSSGFDGVSGLFWYPADLFWHDDIFLLGVADVESEKNKLIKSNKRNKTFRFVGESASWEFGVKGCKKILVEEFHLMVAKDKARKTIKKVKS